jgi:hypothetical protein
MGIVWYLIAIFISIHFLSFFVRTYIAQFSWNVSSLQEQKSTPPPVKENYSFQSRKEILAQDWDEVRKFFKQHSMDTVSLSITVSVNLFFEGEWSNEEKDNMAVWMNNKEFWEQHSNSLLYQEMAKKRCILQKSEKTHMDGSLRFHNALYIIASKIQDRIVFELRGEYVLFCVEDLSQNKLVLHLPYNIDPVGMDWFANCTGT